ncbi:roadblock/LC7 domain-containing protein, partial [Streptomyces tendae]|uniref:roadblock/LC7 domain-containing protein n=1 Tax=Streptomyces tendae TaxID=1932 RepID=UPI003662F1E0
MSTQPAMNNVTGNTPASATTASGQRDSMAWLLRQFAAETPGVLHAVLISRDGLRLLDSDVGKDWADELSAAFSGIASLAANITIGNRGYQKMRNSAGLDSTAWSAFAAAGGTRA